MNPNTVKPKRSRIKTVFLSFGTGSETQMASVILSHERGFKTAHAALHHLLQVAHDAVVLQQAKKDCCVVSAVMSEEANFCSTCGRALERSANVPKNIVPEVVQWLSDLNGSMRTLEEKDVILQQRGWDLGLLTTNADAIDVTAFDAWIQGKTEMPSVVRFHISRKTSIKPKTLYVEI